MDLRFEWKKHPLTASLVSPAKMTPANAGKIALHAVVPALSFEVGCIVTPNCDATTYDWAVHPLVRNFFGDISWMGTWFSKKGAFNEAAAAVADVEEFLRSEAKKCFLGGSAIFDLWRHDLARSFDKKERI